MSPVYLQCERCGYLLHGENESRSMPRWTCDCGATRNEFTRINVTE